MKIKTRNFGEIEIEKEKIIIFEEGIPAFEEEKEFIIILNEDKENPFHCLQSINNQDLSFIVINPFEIFSDYDILLPQTAINKLKIEKEEDINIYTIVVIPTDMKKMTTNLLGPIVINTKERLGKQVILDDERYTTKHFIFNQDSKVGGE
ncbi:flagellar assembly protein FliW [Tissierella carlieri]|uniref:Flagellar assembly factor FliW n=1 Tax=Tissierella carlieri TaxID=689904 RepID=A0ABT1S9S2_9FIRM|nr:flagellar assembly protein FliW [Tissierella carlieri]MCQ4923209.1 flagellar assembly protein FliW [Tissierella carlieri]